MDHPNTHEFNFSFHQRRFRVRIVLPEVCPFRVDSGFILFDRFIDCWNSSLGTSSDPASSSKITAGANAFLSFAHAILLRLPGTDEGILLPNRSRMFLSWNFAGEDTYCLGKAGEGSSLFTARDGLFSFGLSDPFVLKRGCLNGRTGEPKRSLVSMPDVKEILYATMRIHYVLLGRSRQWWRQCYEPSGLGHHGDRFGHGEWHSSNICSDRFRLFVGAWP